MAEEKKATPKKTTKKTTTTKKAEPKVEKKEEVDYESIINQLQEQIKLMQEQMKVKADEPEEKWTKAKLTSTFEYNRLPYFSYILYTII